MRKKPLLPFTLPLDNHDYIGYIDYIMERLAGQPKTTPITVRVENEELARLLRLGEKEDRTLAYLVKQAIRVYLAARNAE